MHRIDNHVGENKRAVQTSPILAKAVLRHESGETCIVVVFGRSTRLEFFWVFRSRSARSSRRSWRFANHFPRNFSTSDPYCDFGSFVQWYARSQNLTVISQRVSHKKRVSALLVKTEHESVFGNWAPLDPRRPVTQDLCRRRLVNARSRRYSW
jgi:hypothetical protein